MIRRFAPLAGFAAVIAVSALGSRTARADDPKPETPSAPPVSPAPKPVEHADLGFQAAPVAAIPEQFRMQLGIPDGANVVAVNILPGGAAEAAGLKMPDVILKIAGQEMPSTKGIDPMKPESMEPFSTALEKITGAVAVGAKVEIVVQRDGKPVTLTLTAVAERGYIGFTATPAALLNAKQKKHWNVKADKGAVALRVMKGSPADKAGLKNGDLVLQYAGQDIPSTKEIDPSKPESGPAFGQAFAKLAATTRPGVETQIVVERDGKPVTLKVTPLSLMDMQKLRAAAGEEDEEDEGDEGDEGPEHGEAPEKAPAPPAPPTAPQPK
jgi:S1-C subfamily serine protease